MWSHFLDPDEDCAKGEICIADFTTHCDDSVAVCAGVLVEEISEGIKLIFDRLPGLFPLRRGKLGGWLLSLVPHEVGAAALMEPEMSHGDHDGQKRFREYFLYVMNEEALHRARPFRKDGSSRVRILEIFSYLVGVGEGLSTARIVDDWEGINWPTVGTKGGRGDVQLAKDVLNVGSFNPMSTIGETLVVENESTGKDYSTVY